jgi:quercetin dioxygenase-like cupin family protein
MRTQSHLKNSTLALVGASIAVCFHTQVGFAQQSDKVPTNQVTISAKDTSRMGWDMLEIPQIKAKIPVKFLETDKETGVMVLLVRYPAGFTNIWHTHPNAHGMYVLDGVLKTHQGEFGPGNWIWFPEGGWMEHGATAKSEVTVLFVTNKKFDIKYPMDKDPWYPMNK